MGVIGLGQMQVKKGDREEFKSLDLTRSVRMRQRNRTHAQRHSHTRYSNQPEVPSRKPPVGETQFPSAHMSNCRNPQPASITISGPGTTIGLDVRNTELYVDYESARGDEWLSLMGSHMPFIANTPQLGPPHVDCTLPSIAQELGNLIDQGNRDLFAGSTANFPLASPHLAEDLPHPSYQNPRKAWNSSSHGYLELFQKWDTHYEEGGPARKNIDGGFVLLL